MKKTTIILLILCLLLSFGACAKEQSVSESTSEAPIVTEATQQKSETEIKTEAGNESTTPSEMEGRELQLTIGTRQVSVEWEDNESVEALRELCTKQPLTIQMSMYGGFEQVGSIGG